MSPQELDHFRVLIETRLAETEAASAKASANAGTVKLDQSSVGRLSRMDAMQQQAMASSQLAALQRQQQQLAAALARVANGSFGACCECGEPIAAARLASDPGTPFCANCQQAREQAR
ncbi:MAG: TraR/DksA C4-type zinc finger protein [Sideroxyarcus sp.]|nr:TraR/DksA C4-type zinc finger protein [Sideroxyarcus sp.]